MEAFWSSNFKIFFNHGEEDHWKSVKLKHFGGIQVIKFQNFLQPWWRRSLKKCEIKVFWRHSYHQISKCSSFWAENVLYLSYFLSILSYIILLLSYPNLQFNIMLFQYNYHWCAVLLSNIFSMHTPKKKYTNAWSEYEISSLQIPQQQM